MKFLLFLVIALLPALGFCSPFEKAQNAKEWEEQRRFLNENGYLWIRSFFDEKGVSSLRSWANAIHLQAQLQRLNGDLIGDLIVVPEASRPSVVCRTEDHFTRFPIYGKWIESKIQSFLQFLTKEPYILFKDKLNFKWPGGGAFSPHQDFPAYDLFPPRSHLNVMVCIDSATLENGCLQIAHNWKEVSKNPREILPYIKGGVHHGTIEEEASKDLDWLPLETQPGDVVIFTSFIPHYSENNLSDSSRRAFFFTYNRLIEGDHNHAYYHAKRSDPQNPVFHIGTPTNARTK